LRTWRICVLVVFVSNPAPQHLTYSFSLLEKQECRRRASAGNGCAGGANTPIPNDRFTPRIEEMRNPPGVHGPARLVHNVIVDFFIVVFRLLAGLAERHRNGTLPVMAPPSPPDQPRPWPAELRPRESGWRESRDLYDPWGDSTKDGQFEQPEVKEPTEALQVGAPCEMPPCEKTPCEKPGVEPPAGLPVPPKARVRKLKVAEPSADARCHDMDASSVWHVALADDAALFRSTIVGFLRIFSKTWVLGGGDQCVENVPV